MISDYLRSAFVNIERNKKNTILIFIFCLLLFLLFIDTFIFKNFYDYYDSAIKRNAGFRTLMVTVMDNTADEAISEIKNVEHVEDVYGSLYDSTAVDSNIHDNGLNGWIGLNYGIKSAIPKTIKGKNIENLISGELVCPYEFYPDSNYGNPLNVDERKFLKEEAVLNREIVVNYNQRLEDGTVKKLTKEMKIVGLYDAIIVGNGINECYASLEDIRDIQNAYNPHLKNNDYFSLKVVVDNEKNLKEVRRSIQDAGMFIVEKETSASLDMGFVGTLFILIFIVAIVITLSIVFIVKNYISKKIKNEAKYLGILRACGYTKRQVIMQEIVENSIILTISFVISIIIFSILYAILNVKIFRYLKYIGFNVSNSVVVLFIIFIFLLITLEVMNYTLVNKKIAESISDILKEE